MPLQTTPAAAAALGVSAASLKRWAAAGLLHEGVHFWRGVYSNSPWRWDVNKTSEVLRPSYTGAR